MVCAARHKSHTHVLRSQANPALSFALSFSLYVGQSHRVLWLMCVVTVWKAQEGKAVLPLMLLLLWTRADKNTHTWMHTQPWINKSQHRSMLPMLTPPSLSISPTDPLPRGLALINPPHTPPLPTPPPTFWFVLVSTICTPWSNSKCLNWQC